MENAYFIFTDESTQVDIERFHICTWEFRNNSALIEFGFEVDVSACLDQSKIEIELFVPWISYGCKAVDLFEKLKESSNSKFIFNDSVKNTEYIDEGQNELGRIHDFFGRGKLCVLSTNPRIDLQSKTVKIELDIARLRRVTDLSGINLYFRFYLEPKLYLISTRKTGIGKSTIIYDIKINENRNLPSSSICDMNNKSLCKINKCFCFNIVPNNYELSFLDNKSLKNVRTLEYDSFNRYLEDKRVKKDELIVVFNKKQENDSYNFFSMFFKERIGAGQFALAILVSLISGILLFIPSFRQSNSLKLTSANFWRGLPAELYISSAIVLSLLFYFIWPFFSSLFSNKNSENRG